MVFSLPSGLALAVEYDGAYWHGGPSQEERSTTSNEITGRPETPRQPWETEDASWSVAGKTRSNRFILMTFRYPRSDPGTCARAVLLHLFDLLYHEFLGSREDSVTGFLRSAARPLAPDDLRCADCQEVARYLLPKDVFVTQPGQKAERG